MCTISTSPSCDTVLSDLLYAYVPSPYFASRYEEMLSLYSLSHLAASVMNLYIGKFQFTYFRIQDDVSGLGKVYKALPSRYLKISYFFNIDIKNSFMIGDRPTDLIPAEKLGVTPVLIKTGYGMKSLEKLEETGLNPVVVNDILDFSEKLKNKKIIIE